MEGVNEYLEMIADADSLEAGSLSRLPPAPPLKISENSWSVQTPQNDNIGRSWDQSQEAATRKSPASQIFLALCLRSPNIPPKVLGGAQWQSFHRFGFGIWDLKRMCLLEMMNPPRNPSEIQQFWYGGTRTTQSRI